MSAEPHNAKSIFLNAAERPAGEPREAYLAEACGPDVALRREVDELLAHFESVGSFLETPEAVPTIDVRSPSETVGTLLAGKYKLLEEIGAGGMGTVWMAQQTEPVRRLVAVKLIRPGMDSRQVLARFEAERQALALMDHPNIARVFDGGITPAGRPYFAMELVKGVPITEYCDDRRLTPRERLELFVPVCQAVQHAHQKGVIHRDLKPSNVLVAQYDDRPVPKVIDFGVAKATSQPLTERTLHTGFGAVVGTVEYMSPEQATLNQLDVDTRSDIYSLGVLLYELLTGTTPLDRTHLGETPLLELLRIVREDDTVRPSTRLSTVEELPAIAARRGVEPRRLSGLVRVELDWVVMRALEKDRGRRYESAGAFATDVQRYLADEPVLACPPSAGYRLRKFVRRNKGPVLAASLVVLALVAGIAGTTVGLVRAERRAEGERRAKTIAENRLAQIENGTEVLASIFRDVDPKAEASEGVTLRVLLGRRLVDAAQQLEGEGVGDPLVVARLQHLLGIALRELAHPKQAETVLVKARLTRERLLGADHLDTAATKHNLAGVYRDQAKYDLAEQVYQEVLGVRGALLGPDHTDTLSTKNNLALLYMDQRRLDLAEPLLKEVLEIRTANLGPNDPKTLMSKNNLAGLYVQQNRWDVAEPLYEEVLAMRITILGPTHRDTIMSKNNLATTYQRRANYADAEVLLKEAIEAASAELGPGHAMTLSMKSNLAGLYHAQAKYALAETVLREVLEMQAAILPAEHPALMRLKRNLAILYLSMKKFDEATPLLQETLKLERAKLRPDHPDLVRTQAYLGRAYRDAGRPADAIPLLEEVRRRGTTDPGLAWVGSSLLTAYAETGKKTEAAALATAQVQAARKRFPADSPQLAAALADVGKAFLAAKAYADAEPLLRESLTLGRQKSPDAWDTHHTSALLGVALLGQKNYAEAERHLVEGYHGMKKSAKDPAHKPRKTERPDLAEALEKLVQLYDAWDKPAEAAKWRTELEAHTKAADQTAKPKQN